MSATQQLTKYIQHCLKKDNKPVRSDIGPLQTQNGVVLLVSWLVPEQPSITGQANGFLDVNKGDSTIVTVGKAPVSDQPLKIPLPTSISGSASWVGGPQKGRGIAIDTFTLKVKGPDSGNDTLKVEIAGLDFADQDSVTTTFTISPFANNETSFFGQATTSMGRSIVFAFSMTTGTQVLNLAAG